MLTSSSRLLCRRLSSTAHRTPPLTSMTTPASPTLSTSPSAPSSSSPPHKTLVPFKDGRFANPWPTWRQNTGLDIARMMWQQRQAPDPLTGVDLSTALPVMKPTWGGEGVTYTWLGHASALIEMYGVTVLLDPVFSQRCGPTQWTGPKRLRPPPCTVDELPPIDLVLISHNHYDHLDYDTCTALALKAEKQRADTGKVGTERVMRWYVGEGIQHWLTANTTARAEDITGMKWWDEATHTLPSPPTSSPASSPTITSVPCQHWSLRNGFDGGRTLWTGFVIRHKGYSIYYSGDTAYCSAFKEIGAALGPIDFAVLPIGAYYPGWFMGVVHTTPEEAVQVMEEVKAKKAVAVHWGTFILSNEPLMEPKLRLEAETAKRGMTSDTFTTTNIGETLTLL